LERLARDLAKKDDLTDWETEFAQGVSERLDKFGSAFADPEKGGRQNSRLGLNRKALR